MPKEVASLRGPIELYRGELAIRIPLAEGGDKFLECTRNLAEVDGEYLTVVIKPWLAEKLGLCEGSLVSVNNSDGKFHIIPVPTDDHDLQ